ncbi:MAG: hypothetical protein H6502_05660 [Candidatus Woesearchaeota archaeon]|nr:MAG: hypothetical protein H6502_05660 [Candidatus Woesearchaeota archaeon]
MRKDILLNYRVIIFVVLLLISILAINPSLSGQGVAIVGVEKNSSAANALPEPIRAPGFSVSPRQLELILEVNGQTVTDSDDYASFVSVLSENDTVIVRTNTGLYELTNKGDALGIHVSDPPLTNIRKGLDLSGGTRVLLKIASNQTASEEDIDLVVRNLEERMNAFGVSDVSVLHVKDFAGDDFVLVEIAGTNKDEVRDLLDKQGKFEAKIGNETVFIGGRDIKHVCRDASCSGLDTRAAGGGCSEVAGGGYACRFFFQITVSAEAAERQADLTRPLEVVSLGTERYLSKNLSMFLDDSLFDSLYISEGLRGNAVTTITISGSGSGVTEEDARIDASNSMKRLQTVLSTGSLPLKLDIVQTDSVSPVLGKDFIRNTWIIMLFAIVGVVAVVMLRYRKISVAVYMVLTLLSEIIIILGIAAMINWRLDIAAIAGLIIVAGTGVDHLIVIADEALGKVGKSLQSKKDKIKNAFFIIIAAFFTTFVAMLPLFTIGAGLLRGFALTTIIGLFIGVFVTRPAYAVLLEKLVD